MVKIDKIRNLPGKAETINIGKEKGALLAIPGSMDYIDKVLPHCELKTKDIINDVKRSPPDLEVYDVVLVGCPGKLKKPWHVAIKKFVEKGGYLITTDWCLDNLVAKVFPNTIAKAGVASGSFPVEVANPSHPFVQGIEDKTGVLWKVESASHLIKVKNEKAVQVLLRSKKMNRHSSILVTFQFGKGHVVHAISHFHLQGGGEEGQYVSAFIITNVIEEAIKAKYQGKPSPRIKIRETTFPPLHRKPIAGSPRRIILKKESR